MKKEILYANQNFDFESFIRAFNEDKHKCEIMDDGILFVFERYYFRNGSAAGASILVRQYEEKYKITIITTAAGIGLFNLSYGADAKLLKSIIEEAQKYGAIVANK